MPLVSKTVEVAAQDSLILSIVADFERYPEWNEEVQGCWILHRYEDGRPSQLRLDTLIQGNAGTYIQAVYYPQPNQIQTVMQQGDHFAKQEQLFSVVGMGPTSLLTVDMDVELSTSMPVPAMMVKKVINEALDHLAGNLKARAEQLSAR
jgi:ribosome-associated toxin RatA of RatAB toxin-antitoxin module